MSEEKIYSPWVHPVGRAEVMACRTALHGFRQYVAITLHDELRYLEESSSMMKQTAIKRR